MTAEQREERILALVRAVPAGFVQAYSDIDRASPRLVGRVLATTSADVPWHRVVRADGTVPLGDRQLDLLRSEGVPLRGRRVDLRHARWPEAAFRPEDDQVIAAECRERRRRRR
jgi:alkylated DNA nucleotide flippase Atl1